MTRRIGFLTVPGVLAGLLLIGDVNIARAAANPMHPIFAPLDSAGAPAFISGRVASSARTCGACHDVDAIRSHDDHWNDRVRVECVSCHFAGGRLPVDDTAYEKDGRLKRQALRLAEPRDEECGACHAVAHTGRDPLALPADFGAMPADPYRTFAMTLTTGEILSGQDISESLLNLRGKDSETHPWDAHLRRLVACIDCHYAANHPGKAEVKRERPGFLASDPRRIGFADYLRRPDHHLVAADCRACHEPLATHDFLPYRERHFAVLDCRACHIPALFGPAARLIDSTVVSADGSPAVVFRGTDARPGDALNAAYLEGYVPLLLPERGADGRERLAPFNAVAIYAWRDGSGRAITWGTVRAAYLDSQGHYRPSVLRVLDTNADGGITAPELRLDTSTKLDAIRAELRALGVDRPTTSSAVLNAPIHHDVQSGARALRDCDACHAKRGRLSDPLATAPYACAGTAPPGPAGPPPMPSLHVFGHARGGVIDRAGFLLFAAVVAGVALHGTLRLRARTRRRSPAIRHQRVYIYGRYERIWHGLMAGSVMVLMMTGIEVHFTGGRGILSLPRAVALHNVSAVVLIVNGFLSLFYHVTTSAIRRFLPASREALDGIRAQARFYLSGIFLGRPHPSPKTPERRLNPLQQVTYLALLNILFPLQVVTGIMIWGASRWPGLADRVGGLTVVAPVHNAGAWLFTSFVVLHLYLITTGSTALSSVRAMVSGFDDVESSHPIRKGASRA